MEFKGIVRKRLDKSGVSKTGKDFIAYQYKIEEAEGQYPQSLLGDIFGDKLEVLNVGDVVTVTYNVKCDEYDGKLYGKNNVWKVDVNSKAYASAPVVVDPLAQIGTKIDPVTGATLGEDDMPF